MFSDTVRPVCPEKIPNKGYTLIEVLVATLIFSSMVMLAAMALNQGLAQYRGIMKSGVNFWDSAKNLWIDESLASADDYYVVDDNNRWFPYFKGDQGMFSYVSLSPLSGDVPVVVWITNERQDDGKHSVVYYELPVYTKGLKEIERSYIFDDYKKGYSVKLLQDVENVRFDYYGYDFLENRNVWSGNFDGGKKIELPSVVRITYDAGGRENVMVYGINTNSQDKRSYYNELYQQ